MIQTQFFNLDDFPDIPRPWEDLEEDEDEE